jgi:23S rRNA (adenine2503-C2)-methyltransferase
MTRSPDRDPRPYLKDLDFEETCASLRSAGRADAREIAKAAHLMAYRSLAEDPRSFAGVLRPERRSVLEASFRPFSLGLDFVERSEVDGTRKLHFRLEDGGRIESVLIPNRDHFTLCLSSQAGCPLACGFCATGLLGLRRNLLVREIVDQYVQAQRIAERRITDVVFMGMGEPFLNYDRVLKASSILNDRFGPQVASKKISISTAGIPEAIRRFANEGWLYRLLVSLTAADPAKRRILMPIEERHPLDELLDAIRYYFRRMEGKRYVTLEYVAIKGVNMGDDDVDAIVRNITGFKFILNVIPFNPIGNGMEAPTFDEVRAFTEKLRPHGFPVKIRYSGGRDRLSGCGQLGAAELGVASPGPLLLRPGVAIA